MGKSEGDSYVVFEDYFPAMVEKLGSEGFMKELCKGFEMLMDGDKGVITLESLKLNSALLLGSEDDTITNNEEILWSMLQQGDVDGDGCLNLMEFCVLMFRLSPAFMDQPTTLFRQRNY